MRYAVFLPALFLGAAFPAYEAPAKACYVNVAEVIGSAKQGKRVKAQLEKQFEQAKKGMATVESRLKREKESLEREAPLLSEKTRARKIQKFQQKVIESQQQMEAKKRDLQAMEERLMGPVIENLKAASSRLAAKEGCHSAHNVGKDVLWVSPDFDLTKKVTAQFNKKYK